MPDFRLLVSLAVLCLVAGACGSAVSDAVTGSPAATVNGVDLTEDELDRLEDERREQQIASYRAQQPEGTIPPAIEDPPDDQLISQWIVDQLVQSALDERGVVLTEGDRLSGQYLTAPGSPQGDIDRSVIQIRLAYELSDLTAPTVADVEQWLADNPIIASTCASHIIVDTEADAEAALERLDQGEDFATVAMEVSVGPSAPDGGDLGCLPPGQFVPEFEAAMDAAVIGEPTDPVESQFGWHVILVTEREVGEIDEAARETARRNLLSNDLEVLREQYLQFLLDTADDVTVNPRYGTWSAEDGAVRPPEGADPPGIDATVPADDAPASLPPVTVGS